MGLAQRFRRLLTGRTEQTRMTSDGVGTARSENMENKMINFTEKADVVNSQAVTAILWDTETNTLGVRLTTNEDDTYVYYDVAPEHLTAFKGAQSKGYFYNAFIKGQYKSDVVSNDDVTVVTEPVVEDAPATAPALAMAVVPGGGQNALRVTWTITGEAEVGSLGELADLAEEHGFEIKDITSILPVFQ